MSSPGSNKTKSNKSGGKNNQAHAQQQHQQAPAPLQPVRMPMPIGEGPLVMPGDETKGFAPDNMPAFKNILQEGFGNSAMNFESNMPLDSEAGGVGSESAVQSAAPSNMNFDDKNENYKSDFDDGASEIHMSDFYAPDVIAGPTSANIEAMRQQLYMAQADVGGIQTTLSGSGMNHSGHIGNLGPMEAIAQSNVPLKLDSKGVPVRGANGQIGLGMAGMSGVGVLGMSGGQSLDSGAMPIGDGGMMVDPRNANKNPFKQQ